jgi:peroxiredoxin
MPAHPRPAPSLELPTADGRTRSLEEFRGGPVIVSFLNNAGCLFCRAHVIKVIQARQAISSAGANVIFVVFDDPELVMSRMMHDLDLPYVLMVDADRTTYARWGLGRVTLKSRLMPGLYWATLKEVVNVMVGRERALKQEPDQGQLGGDFVVDREGRLVFEHRLKSFHDRARIDDLLTALTARVTT